MFDLKLLKRINIDKIMHYLIVHFNRPMKVDATQKDQDFLTFKASKNGIIFTKTAMCNYNFNFEPRKMI